MEEEDGVCHSIICSTLLRASVRPNSVPPLVYLAIREAGFGPFTVVPSHFKYILERPIASAADGSSLC